MIIITVNNTLFVVNRWSMYIERGHTFLPISSTILATHTAPYIKLVF